LKEKADQNSSRSFFVHIEMSSDLISGLIYRDTLYESHEWKHSRNQNELRKLSIWEMKMRANEVICRRSKSLLISPLQLLVDPASTDNLLSKHPCLIKNHGAKSTVAL